MAQELEKDTEFIDLKKVVTEYIKYWYIFVMSIVLCYGVAYVYLKITDPTYQINANLMIKEESSGKGGMQSTLLKNFSFGGAMGASAVDDEIEVIASHTIMRSVVQQLGLQTTYVEKRFLKDKEYYTDSPVQLLVANDILDTLSTSLKFKCSIENDALENVKVYDGRKVIAQVENKKFPAVISTPYGIYTLDKTKYFKKGKPFTMEMFVCGYDAMAENYNKQVNCAIASKKSNVIGLSVQDKIIKRGKDVLNLMIANFNTEGIKEKNIEAANTSKFLNDRLALIAGDLTLVEKNVEDYKKANNLTDIETEAKILLTQNGEFKPRLLEVETQYAVIGLVENFITDPQNKYELIPFSVGLADKSATEAVQSYNEKVLERMRLLHTTNELSPMMHTIKAQIDALRGNVVTTVSNMKRGIEITLHDLRTQEQKFMSRIQGMPTQEREFMDIKRQQVIKEELYIFLLQKKEETDLTLAIATPKGRIIDRAYHQNEPVAPNKMMFLGLVLALGMLAPILFFYLKNLLKNKFATREELEAMTNVTILGEICDSHSSDPVVVKQGEFTSIIELFRLLRTNMQFVIKKNADKVIMTTSTVSGEGKSFIATNLAMSLTLMGKKVVLIGLDIRNPRLSEYLHIKNKKGLGATSYLADDTIKIDDLIIPYDDQPLLSIILSGPIPPNPGELLQSDRLDTLLSVLRETYDFIILDTAPVGMVADTFSLAKHADLTLYVCRANYSAKDNIKFANNIVATNRLHNVSFVLNGTHATKGYGYGYGYGYGKKTL